MSYRLSVFKFTKDEFHSYDAILYSNIDPKIPIRIQYFLWTLISYLIIKLQLSILKITCISFEYIDYNVIQCSLKPSYKVFCNISGLKIRKLLTSKDCKFIKIGLF